jgi:hypothetical protein
MRFLKTQQGMYINLKHVVGLGVCKGVDLGLPHSFHIVVSATDGGPISSVGSYPTQEDATKALESVMDDILDPSLAVMQDRIVSVP